MISWISSYRKILGATLVAMAALLAAGFAPWRASQGFREATLRRMAVVLNAPDLTAHSMRFHLLPSPRLAVTGLAFSQTDGIVSGVAQGAVIHLEFASLLAGRAKPIGIALSSPNLSLRLPALGAGGFRDAGSISGTLAQIMAAQTRGSLLQRLDLDNARLSLRQEGSATPHVFEDVRLRLRAAGARHPVSLSFRGRQGSDEIRLAFLGATPLRVITGTREPLSFAYWSPGASLEFEGEGILSSNLMLKGVLSASGDGTLGGLVSGTLTRMLGGPSARLTLKSMLDFSARGANFSDLRLTLDNDRFDGVGSVRHDGQRWNISGTLATESADASNIIAPLKQLRRADGGWNTTTFDTDRLFTQNVDLRISAEKLGVFGHSLEKVAVSVLTRANKAEVTLGDALWNKGSARFRATASPGSFGLDLRLNAALDKADFGTTLTALTGARRLSGNGTANLVLETSGSSVAQFVTNAEGRVAALLRGGEILGIDLFKLAARRDLRRELALAESLGGKTPFETIALSLKFSNGATQSVDGHMRSGRLAGTLQGSIDFAGAVHDLAGTVVQLPSDPQGAEPATVLEYSITGPLTEPRISPNVAFLLRRS